MRIIKRVQKSLKRFWWPSGASWLVSLSYYCICCVFFSGFLKSIVVSAPSLCTRQWSDLQSGLTYAYRFLKSLNIFWPQIKKKGSEEYNVFSYDCGCKKKALSDILASRFTTYLREWKLLSLYMFHRVIFILLIVSGLFLYLIAAQVVFSRTYSYFEKGCRKNCTRQSRKVLWVVLSSLFFKEIWKNGTRGHGRMFARPKGKQEKKFWQLQCQEQCIDHIPYYLSGLSCAHFCRQPFSK